MDDGEHIKDVYAHFGLAVYLAQVLEHGIMNALACTDLIPRCVGRIKSRKQWTDEFSAFMQGHFERPLGALIKVFKQHVSTPSGLEQTLGQALKRRNILAHGYFRQRAAEFLSFAGREAMIKELQEAQRLFRDADAELEAVAKPFREQIGFTDDRLKTAYEEFCRKARANC
jgi:hypothetical protein